MPATERNKHNVLQTTHVRVVRHFGRAHVGIALRPKQKGSTMRFISFQAGRRGLALLEGDVARGLLEDDPNYPGDLAELVGRGDTSVADAAHRLRAGKEIDLESVGYLPPFGQTGKLICLGINYLDHVKETGSEVPPHPTIFGRFASSLVGHKANIIRPKVSAQLDYEGELVAVIGKPGRHISESHALEHVVGYSVFNDATIRDFQVETPQWTVGKNFDGTGAMGPVFVTADEVPPGGSSLRLQTRLNGEVVQDAKTSEMIYGVAFTISFLSEAFTLNPGDVLIMGTPPGVGAAREPQLFMKPGDTVEVEIEGLGVLTNSIADEQ